MNRKRRRRVTAIIVIVVVAAATLIVTQWGLRWSLRMAATSKTKAALIVHDMRETQPASRKGTPLPDGIWDASRLPTPP